MTECRDEMERFSVRQTFGSIVEVTPIVVEGVGIAIKEGAVAIGGLIKPYAALSTLLEKADDALDVFGGED